MSTSTSLHQLITAISSAVIEAQDAIERHQLKSISQYFDEDGRPLSLKLMLPYAGARTDREDFDNVSVPILSLVETNLLAISEFEADFEVEMGNLDDSGPAPASGLGPSQNPGAKVDVPQIGLSECKDTAAEPSTTGGEKVAKPPLSQTAPPAPPRALQVTMATKASATSGAIAKVRIQVKGRRPSEGTMRLLSSLNKLF